MSGFTNKPKILRGAFIEYGLSLPPLFVVFQFNPNQLTRNRSLHITAPNIDELSRAGPNDLRSFHQEFKSLTALREEQQVWVKEETISFDIFLDAADQLDAGDTITEQFGIAPQLATLELLLLPKEESLIGSLFANRAAFSFTRSPNPPLVLFIWGRKRVLPVNINSMSITETRFSHDLNPLQATVSVNLTVIEGQNMAYRYSKALLEAMSVLNLANITDIAHVMIPE